MQLLHSTDVFIVGGGPAGLAAAIAARRRGMNVMVADPSQAPIDKACGEGIMPDGLAAAEALGIRLENLGRPFHGIRFCHGADRVEAEFPQGHGLGIRRVALHRVMAEQAESAGVRLLWGTKVTGIGSGRVYTGDRAVATRWIVGADGGNSSVRLWAGLNASARDTRRFGFRRHYSVAPWSQFMEVHWGDACQLYITPTGEREVCAVLISSDSRLRLEEALPRFPEVAARLSGAPPLTPERGAVSASRCLRRVTGASVALVGDASGSVDAVTGEGLCLLFQQSLALGEALEKGDLRIYEKAHGAIGQRPARMADLMLLLDRRARLRRRALHALAADPALFSRLLAMHLEEHSRLRFWANGFSLGWKLLTV